MCARVQLSTRIVGMAERGRKRPCDVHGAPAAKIDYVPHGNPDMPFAGPSCFKGMSDCDASFATVSLDELLAVME
jgi:hypothetical protein